MLIKFILRFFIKILSFLSRFLEDFEFYLWSLDNNNIKKNIRKNIKDRAVEWECHTTEFGKEFDDLIVEHIPCFNTNETEDSYYYLMLQDILFDYDSLISKYGGLVPAKNIDEHIPSDVLQEEGWTQHFESRECYHPDLPLDKIMDDIRRNFVFLRETSGHQTPIWVQISQYIEKKKNKGG